MKERERERERLVKETPMKSLVLRPINFVTTNCKYWKDSSVSFSSPFISGLSRQWFSLNENHIMISYQNSDRHWKWTLSVFFTSSQWDKMPENSYSVSWHGVLLKQWSGWSECLKIVRCKRNCAQHKRAIWPSRAILAWPGDVRQNKVPRGVALHLLQAAL